jgi:hypothetical protein
MSDPVGDRTEQVATYSADATITDHDQIGVDFFGNRKKGVRRFPQACDRMHGNAGIVQVHPRPADDLLGGDTFVVTKPRWHQCSPGGTYAHHRGSADRPICRHDQNLRTGQASKFPRYIDRTICGR